jgi:GH15 family glucan-1,4-alpha-glucosidase
MSVPIEDYGLIGDTHTCALVGRDGSIDWWCVPRFDSGSCFARLLGDDHDGRWLLAPVGEVTATSRRYVGPTLVLETEMTTETGTVRLIDFLPLRKHHVRMVRIVEGVSGRVECQCELVMRFDYGAQIPWVHKRNGQTLALAGPDGLAFDSTVKLSGHNRQSQARFTVAEGQRVPFVLSWYRSHEHPPPSLDAEQSLADTLAWWETWCNGVAAVHGEWQPQVLRSLITLKSLTYAPTGGIVAAATTSLPEAIGGVRNWDYRYCWVRDATLTLEALVEAGLVDEASDWMRWLIRAAAGAPEQLQIMYGPAGERRLTEFEVDGLAGYEGSLPVRVGNAASEQFQLDVYGELMDTVDRARKHGTHERGAFWDLQRALMDFVEGHWCDPDDGIWEVRGPRRHFVHSKVMAWVAFDRAVRAVERDGLPGPVERWRACRDRVHAEVCEQGWNDKVGAFTQYYGSDELDASVLMIPLVGFLPATDSRVIATVEAVQRELLVDGFVQRYQNRSGVDGLPGTEGAFLPCTFWLADCLARMGRLDEARATFERLLGLANDLGLLSEEYDPARRRLVGNFPQAFTHVGLVNTARNLARALAVAAPASNRQAAR